MKGMFATSKAGHDKNQPVIIINEDSEYVYVVDGKYRTVEKPKKKNKKHVQLIKKADNKELIYKIEQDLPITNEEIKWAIKQWLKI